MTKINFELSVPHGREALFFETLASLFGGSTPQPVQELKQEVVKPKAVEKPVIQEEKKVIETATKKAPPAEVEKAVKSAPQYSVEVVRAKAKEVAKLKGKDFIREALDNVGASSVSTIEADKFEDFMKLLGDE